MILHYFIDDFSRYHYKKGADLRRVFSQRRGGSNRPHGAPAVKFTAGDFNVATLCEGGKIYAVAPLEPPLRVGAVDRPYALGRSTAPTRIKKF